MSPNLKIPVPGTWAADLATNSLLITSIKHGEWMSIDSIYTWWITCSEMVYIQHIKQLLIDFYTLIYCLPPESRIFNYPCFWLYRMILPGCYRVKILFPHIFHYFNKKYSRTRALDQLKVFKRFTTKSMHVLH